MGKREGSGKGTHIQPLSKDTLRTARNVAKKRECTRYTASGAAAAAVAVTAVAVTAVVKSYDRAQAPVTRAPNPPHPPNPDPYPHSPPLLCETNHLDQPPPLSLTTTPNVNTVAAATTITNIPTTTKHTRIEAPGNH